MEAGRKRKLREEKRPACDACRAHKLRCDAFLDYSRSCSRCLKKQIACIVQDERRKKTPADENMDIRSISPPHDTALPPPAFTIPIPPTSASSSIPPAPPLNANVGLAPTASVIGDAPGTESRTLGHVHVEATMIDICFSRFDRYYAPLVPILSSKPSPNQTFRDSPLKFWVLVAIGSRKCLEDPTLFSTLSPHVETLAMASLCLPRSSPYPIIEALLLMCTWHLSTDRPFWRSIYGGTLSSATVTLTLQAGMHHCLSLHGVFSAPTPEVERGAKLWAYAVVLNQSSMSIHGFPINDPLTSRHLVWGHKCCETVPSWLVLHGRVLAIVIRFHRVVSDLGSETGLKSHSKTLKSLITAFEAELLDLNHSVQLEGQGLLTKLDVAIARLQIRSIALLTTQDDSDYVDRTQLSNAAILTMEVVSELDSTIQISLHCPDYVFQGILLAACTLLKLLKSYPSSNGSYDDDQTRALFSAINICKNISVVNNDIPAKVSEILAQLWSSQHVYRDADGNYICSLIITNRLAMSVVFDGLWWWKKLSMAGLNSHQQPVQNLDESTISGPSHSAEDPSSLGQLFFDDYWNWGLDWDGAGTLDIQALSNDHSDHSSYDAISRE